MRVVLLAAVLTTSVAHAHIALTSPQPRYADQKLGPCGKGSLDARTQNVTTFNAGETITVQWSETINHPGHYRIAFDEDGQDGFFDPASFTDTDGGPGVLLDGIADKAGGTYSAQVTLPDAGCTQCTLQLIQVMTDKPPYGDGNDLYFQCADLVLIAPDAGTQADAGTEADAGTVEDAGVIADAGLTADEQDGGIEPGDDIRTGCGCSAGADLAFVVAPLASALLRRRATSRRRRWRAAPVSRCD